MTNADEHSGGGHGFLCFDFPETKEHELRWMEEVPLGSRKLPTPVLSGSGSRVFLSPAILRSTPVSMTPLKHREARKANGARPACGYSAASFATFCSARDPAAAASEAIVARARTSIMACCASIQTGCAGQCALRGQERPGLRQTLRQIAPSMASITSRIDAAAPRGAM